MENHNYMLIADDAGEFRDTCKAALEAKGFEVEVCRKDGRALLDMIREKKPTAVLMEALMSGLDGLGVLMAVSRGECGVQPTIFTMTGMDAPGITNQLIRAGSAYHFVKPFDPDIIAERVEMMCARRRAKKRLPRPVPPWKWWIWKPSSPRSSWRSASRRISRATSISGMASL